MASFDAVNKHHQMGWKMWHHFLSQMSHQVEAIDDCVSSEKVAHFFRKRQIGWDFLSTHWFDWFEAMNAVASAILPKWPETVWFVCLCANVPGKIQRQFTHRMCKMLWLSTPFSCCLIRAKNCQLQGFTHKCSTSHWLEKNQSPRCLDCLMKGSFIGPLEATKLPLCWVHGAAIETRQKHNCHFTPSCCICHTHHLWLDKQIFWWVFCKQAVWLLNFERGWENANKQQRTWNRAIASGHHGKHPVRWGSTCLKQFLQSEKFESWSHPHTLGSGRRFSCRNKCQRTSFWPPPPPAPGLVVSPPSCEFWRFNWAVWNWWLSKQTSNLGSINSISEMWHFAAKTMGVHAFMLASRVQQEQFWLKLHLQDATPHPFSKRSVTFLEDPCHSARPLFCWSLKQILPTRRAPIWTRSPKNTRVVPSNWRTFTGT